MLGMTERLSILHIRTQCLVHILVLINVHRPNHHPLSAITTIGLLFFTRRHVLREMAERSTIHDHLKKLHTYDTPPAIRDVSQGMITSTVWELVP